MSIAQDPVRALAALALALLASCSREVVRAGRTGGLRLAGAETCTARAETGTWSWWYPDGELREQGSYEHGRRAGVWTQWYPNGQKRAQGERRFCASTGRSEREGVWVFWHPNGREAARGLYCAGLRCGLWEYTNQDGGLDGDASGEYDADRKLDGER